MSRARIILKKIRKSNENERHGKSNSKEYRAWSDMNSRCSDKNSADYKHYGARGITVGERWRHSFVNFLQDMGSCPTDKSSIERKDNNGNYEPSNCCWLDMPLQSQNRRMGNES